MLVSCPSNTSRGSGNVMQLQDELLRVFCKLGEVSDALIARVEAKALACWPMLLQAFPLLPMSFNATAKENSLEVCAPTTCLLGPSAANDSDMGLGQPAMVEGILH